MNFKLTFIPDEAYYKEAYDDIISSLKYKKYEPLFAVIMIALGIVLYFLNSSKSLGIFSFIISFVGMYELFKLYYERKQWLKDRLNSKVFGQQIELQFTEEIILHTGPFTNGEMNWKGIHKIVKTKNGILIKPENGISIYLQNKLFNTPEEIEFIMSKQKK